MEKKFNPVWLSGPIIPLISVIPFLDCWIKAIRNPKWLGRGLSFQLSRMFYLMAEAIQPLEPKFLGQQNLCHGNSNQNSSVGSLMVTVCRTLPSSSPHSWTWGSGYRRNHTIFWTMILCKHRLLENAATVLQTVFA